MHLRKQDAQPQHDSNSVVKSGRFKFPHQYDHCPCGRSKSKQSKICILCVKIDGKRRKDKSMTCPLCRGHKSRYSPHCRQCTKNIRRQPDTGCVFYIGGEPCRRISTSDKRYVIVDRKNYVRLSAYNWRTIPSAYTRYALGHIAGGEHSVRMHRLIMNAPPEKDVDHINGNGLDNRESNLRLCVQSQNGANRGLGRNNTSGFKGVSYHQARKYWKAEIKVNYKPIFLGRFDKAEDAARAYDRAAIEYFGEFAFLNFPQIIDS